MERVIYEQEGDQKAALETREEEKEKDRETRGLKLKDLQKLCEELKIKKSGTKSDLISRDFQVISVGRTHVEVSLIVIFHTPK